MRDDAPPPPPFVPSGQCKEATYCLALAPQYGCPSAPRSTTFEARHVHMESRRLKANVRTQLCVVACSPGDGSRNMLKVMNTTSNRTDSMKSRHMQLEGRKHGVRLQVRATRMKSCSWFALPTCERFVNHLTLARHVVPPVKLRFAMACISRCVLKMWGYDNVPHTSHFDTLTL